MTIVHASAVRFDGRGILIRGASGSGKSALALNLLADDPTSRLIADDRVILEAGDGGLRATVPAPIAGLIEVRGQGIIRRPYLSPAAIDLVVDLRPPAECPRMPGPADEFFELHAMRLPRLILPAGIADGPLRVRIALERLLPAKA